LNILVNKMIKAIIFDLNGIFLQSPKLSDRFEKDFNIKSAVFLPKLSGIMDKVRKPNAEPAFSYWKEVLDEWKVKLNEKEFWNYWFGGEVQSERMIAFSKELREKGIRIFILSNNFKERASFYGHYPWVHDCIDRLYFSWQTGFVKPDVKAWELVLNENGLKAEECLYFDDQEKNVKAAESIGIKSFIFKSEKDLEEIVNKYLVS